MDFSFTAEQEDLRRAIRDVAADRASSADVRRAMDSPTGQDPALWSLLSEDLGLTGLGVDDELGGCGGDFVDVAIVLEEAGAALLPAPLLPTLVSAAALTPEPAGAAVLRELYAGGAPAALAVGGLDATGSDRLTGMLHNVIDGGLAGLFVVAAPDGLWTVAAGADGVTVQPRAGLDPTRRQAVVRFEGAAGRPVGDAEASARAVDVLRVALAAESVGLARRCLDSTVAHLKSRVQFGRPIGSFQALAHRAADLLVLVESAASTAYYAAWTVGGAPGELPVVAPLALSVCAETAWQVAAAAIQMHGGIGFTWEHDTHLYFKRASTTRLLLGNAYEQRRLVAARAGLAG